jgi:hypothetical protein
MKKEYKILRKNLINQFEYKKVSNNINNITFFIQFLKDSIKKITYINHIEKLNKNLIELNYLLKEIELLNIHKKYNMNHKKEIKKIFYYNITNSLNLLTKHKI